MTGTFSKTACKAAQVKAPAPIIGGKRSGTTTLVANVYVIPLMPASSEIINLLALHTPTKLLVTYVQVAENVNLEEGYTLILDGVEYPIRDANRWPWRTKDNNVTYELVLEDLQNR